MIRLGYELRTGKAVDIPLDHTAVTGRTQQSGKTTTLEALVHRSGLRAVVFVTKKAESGFRQAHTIPPFFIESADWQFVSAVLESTIHQNLKFERSWIMDACKGARSLKEVQDNVQTALHGVKNPHYGEKKKGRKRDDREWQKKPATGMNYGVLNVLDGYLQIVVPQIETLPYTKTLDLNPGLNVMDLHQYSTELQALVIRSVLEWVYQHEKNTVVIIPEAWEFIPQNRRSPVLLAAEELIRKGAASKNFVWLDAQDIAAMHKSVLRSVGVWILGVQREANEIKRMLNHIPAPRPSATDVMMLERGQFFVCYQNVMKKAYVQPFWVGDEHARAIAMGEEPTASVEKIWSESERELVAANPEKKHTPAEPSQGRKYEIQKNSKNIETSTSEVIVRGEMPKEFPNAAEVLGAIPPGKTVGDAMQWMDEFEAIGHHSAPPTGTAAAGATQSEELMWKEKFEAAQEEIRLLKMEIQLLTVGQGSPSPGMAAQGAPEPGVLSERGIGVGIAEEDPLPQLRPPKASGHNPIERVHITDFSNGAYEMFKARLLKDAQVIAVLDARPKIVLNVQRPTLDMDASSLGGKIAKLLSTGFFKTPQNGPAVSKEMKRRGTDQPTTNWYKHLDRLTELGFLTREVDGYQANPEMQIEVREATGAAQGSR